MDPRKIIREVRQLTGNRDRSPSTAEIRALAKKVKKEDGNLRPVVKALLKDRSIGALKLGLSLMPTTQDSYEKELAEIIELTDDENWEIREYAADALTAILQDHFEELEEYLHDLRSSPSENVRRAVVVALKYLGKGRQPHRCKRILRILSRYMDDDSPYVQRNLGPFAIGDGLIEYCPPATVTMLKKMSQSQSSNARWNVAAVFTAATGTNYFEEVRADLFRLLHDPEPKVRKTALKAIRIVARRHSDSRRTIANAIADKTLIPLHGQKALDGVLEECK